MSKDMKMMLMLMMMAMMMMAVMMTLVLLTSNCKPSMHALITKFQELEKL